MRRFLDLVQSIKTKGVGTPYGSEDDLQVSRASFKAWDLIEKCRPFVFSPGPVPPEVGIVDDVEFSNHAESVPLEIDAPFEVFSIEVAGEGPLAVAKVNNQKSVLTCLLVIETSPKHYTFWAMYSVHLPNGLRTDVVMQSPVFQSVLTYFLGRLQRERVGVEKVRQKVKLGEGKSKRFHTISEIVHVRMRDEVSEGTGKESIDWSHRFEVRGHWRKIGGIGKDREGIYCIDQYTWVTDFVKGAEHLPLVRKTRLVNDQAKLNEEI